VKRVVSLAFAVLVTIPVTAGPSSDDADRPANRAPKPDIKARVNGFFERVQGKLGMSADCEISRIGDAPYCATHRSASCAVLSEGTFDTYGRWVWCDPVVFDGPYCASHRRRDCPILSRGGDSETPVMQTCQFGTKEGRRYCVVHRTHDCVPLKTPTTPKPDKAVASRRTETPERPRR
jgi:hypothetical protein